MQIKGKIYDMVFVNNNIVEIIIKKKHFGRDVFHKFTAYGELSSIVKEYSVGDNLTVFFVLSGVKTNSRTYHNQLIIKKIHKNHGYKHS